MARLYPSQLTGQFDCINYGPSASGPFTFPTQGNKSKKNRKGNKMADKYILTVKNGEVNYGYNDKTGTYDTKRSDRVEEFSNLAEALSEWLYTVNDNYDHNGNKVTLTFVPAKKKGKK